MRSNGHKAITGIIDELEDDVGAPFDAVIDECVAEGIDESYADRVIDELKKKGAAYEPCDGRLRYIGSD